VLAQPRRERAQTGRSLALVDALVLAGGGQRLLAGAGEEPERLDERLVWRLQAEEHLLGLLVVLVVGRLVRLEEVEVEVVDRPGGAALVRRAEEQPAQPVDLALPPLHVVQPDARARNRRLVGALHDLRQGFEVVAVELASAQGLGLLGDQRVEVDVLLQVEVVLTVLLVEGDELPVDGPQDLHQHFFDQRLEERGVLLGGRQDQAQVVAQLGRRGAEWGEDVPRREAVDRQGVDDTARDALVPGLRVSLLDAVLEHSALVDDLLDLGDRAEGGVVAQRLPVAVVGDEPGLVAGHGLIDDAPDGHAECLEDLTLLGDEDAREGLQVGRVDGEEPDERVHPLVHRAVEGRELRQVLPDPPLLRGALLEQALGHDVRHVLPGDAHLLEAVLHAPQRLGHELEVGALEEALLDAGDEAEAADPADLADLPQEVQIEDQVLAGLEPRAEVVEQLVEHEEQPLLRVLLLERLHHLEERVLVVGHLVRGGEAVGDAEVGELLLQRGADDVPERHRGRPDLGAHHLELPGDGAGLVGDERVLGRAGQLGVLGDGRNQRHQVRLAGPVVADDEETFVVRRLVEPQLLEHQVDELVRHPLRDDEGLDQAAGVAPTIRLPELDHRLDGLEVDEVGVLHAIVSLPVSGPVARLTGGVGAGAQPASRGCGSAVVRTSTAWGWWQRRCSGWPGAA